MSCENMKISVVVFFQEDWGRGSPPYDDEEGLQLLRDFTTESIEEHEASLEAGSPRVCIKMFLI